MPQPLPQLTQLLADHHHVSEVIAESRSRVNDAALTCQERVQSQISAIQTQLQNEGIGKDPELEAQYLRLLRDRRALQQIIDRIDTQDNTAAEFEALAKSLGLRP